MHMVFNHNKQVTPLTFGWSRFSRWRSGGWLRWSFFFFWHLPCIELFEEIDKQGHETNEYVVTNLSKGFGGHLGHHVPKIYSEMAKIDILHLRYLNQSIMKWCEGWSQETENLFLLWSLWYQCLPDILKFGLLNWEITSHKLWSREGEFSMGKIITEN